MLLGLTKLLTSKINKDAKEVVVVVHPWFDREPLGGGKMNLESGCW